MKIRKQALTILLSLIMISGGILHFLKPAMYAPFFPDYFPKTAIIYSSGLLEIMVGIGAFIPRFRSMATLGILLLMLAFLPLHVIDVFKEKPVVGSYQMALIRLPLQFILIAWAWFIWKK
jgi:uncharacterized membrane protein